MYELFKYVHILCAITWVGGAFTLQLVAMRVVRSPDAGDLPKLLGHIEFLGRFVLEPASVVLLLAGVVMTIQRWTFQQTWISIAVVLWLVSLAAGSLYLLPQSKRAKASFAADGPASAAGRAVVGRMFLVARIELATFLVIIALMVVKPTLG